MLWSLILFSVRANAGVNPPGAEIQNAVVVDIPPSGFANIVDIIPGMLPLEIPIDPISQDVSRGGSTCLDDVWFDISNVNIEIEVADASIVPKDGYLDFSVSLDVNVNDAINPFLLDYMLSLCIEYNCQGYVDPFQVDISSQIFLDVADTNGDGINDLDATFDNFNYNYDLASNDINIENCALGVFEDVLNFFGWSLFDLFLGIVSPVIEGTVTDMLPTLESTLEDSFGMLSINQSVDLMGSTLNIALQPEDIVIKPAGLRVQMNGSASTDASAECMTTFDLGGSLATPTTLRNIGYAPPGVSGDVLVTVDDDFANQALYSVWRSGVLCQTIDASTFPIDTGILNLITGDAFVELFPETSPLVIQTQPVHPLELNMATASDVAIDVNELGLDFFAEVDGRQTRILQMGITTDVGVNIPFNATTGDLVIEMDLSGDRIDPSLPYNEFLPASEDLIKTSFVEQFDTILGLIDIESLLGNFAFTLPSINGAGLTGLDFSGTGQNSADLGAFARIGPVPYSSAGCGSDAGGCGGGCSSQGTATSRLTLLMGVLLFGLLRRRAS